MWGTRGGIHVANEVTMPRFRKRTLPPECYYTKQEAMEQRNKVREEQQKISTNPIINTTIKTIKSTKHTPKETP